MSTVGGLQKFGRYALLALALVSCRPNIRSYSRAPGANTPALFSQFFSQVFNRDNGNMIGACLAIDPVDGARYTANLFDGSVTIGADTFTSAGGYDFLVTKQDRAGNYIWAKQVEGNNLEQTLTGAGKCMTIAAGRAFFTFITISTTITVDGNSYPRIGQNDSFIIGFNESDGFPGVVRQFGVSATYYLMTGLTSSGNTVYWSGWTSDTATISGPAGDCLGMCAAYGAVNATTGADVWAKRWSSDVVAGSGSQAMAITIGHQNDLYLVGNYHGANNDPGIGSPLGGTTIGFIEKVSSVDGSPAWIRSIANTSVSITSVGVDPQEDVYVGMSTPDASLNFEGQGSLPVTAMGNLASYDASGNFKWNQSISNSYIPSQIEYDSLTSSFFASHMSLGISPGPILSRFRPNGTFIETKTGDVSAGSLYGLSLALDPNAGSVVVLGTYVGSVELEGQTFSTAGTDETTLFTWK